VYCDKMESYCNVKKDGTHIVTNLRESMVVAYSNRDHRFVKNYLKYIFVSTHSFGKSVS
jgi:hypothetical protein